MKILYCTADTSLKSQLNNYLAERGMWLNICEMKAIECKICLKMKGILFRLSF